MARLPLSAGTLLDERFEIVDTVGEGSFGITYRSLDRARGIDVAVKEFFPAAKRERDSTQCLLPAIGDDEITSIVSEALRQEAVRHPAIARVVRAFSQFGTAYIAMDWIDGVPMSKCVSTFDRSEPHLLRTFLTVADAILHAEARGLSHGDISPNNVMVAGNGDPVLIDFGSARAIDLGDAFAGSRAAPGTAGFTAPFGPMRDDGRGDFYSLSACMHWLLLFRPPSTDAADPGRSLLESKRRGHRTLGHYSDEFLAVLDHGLSLTPDPEPWSGPSLLSALGISRDRLQKFLAPDVFANTLLLRADGSRVVAKATALPATHQLRYQRALLQAFDSARFQSINAQRRDGLPLQSPLPDKIALARTEALLNLAFGREIVVPAGQVADSPAFFAIFSEITPHYVVRAAAIAKALQAQGMAQWVPFRLALEDPQHKNYVDFAIGYRYTGANLVLLKQAGKDAATVEATARAMAGLAQLFVQEKYDDLEKAVGTPGYARFARLNRSYFTDDKSVHARPDVPVVSGNEYARVFYERLNDKRIVGKGVAEARASLGFVEEIEAKLKEANAVGMRGNWYLFADGFGGVWPLARCYLDMCLFLNLARQYRIDHPILTTQEFELDTWDDSLILGPKFAIETGSGVTHDALRTSVLLGESRAPIPWQAVLELYTNPSFLQSVSSMNQAFFGENATPGAYADRVRSHGELLNTLLPHVLHVTEDGARVRATTPQDTSGRLVLESYEPSLRKEPGSADAQNVASDMVGPFGETGFDAVDTRKFTNGTQMADALLYYFMKPYRGRSVDLDVFARAPTFTTRS